MKKSEKTIGIVLMPTVLTLFDGAASGGASSGASGAGTATSAGATDGSGASAQTTAKPKVVYGKQDSEAPEVQTARGQAGTESQSPYANLSPEEKEKSYYNLVRGEFKDQFAAHSQKIINDRFKQTSQLESRLNETQPIVDMLMMRYGAKSINQLNAMLEEEVIPDLADQAGMSTEAYKEHVKLQRENAQLRQQMNQTSVNERVETWQKQAASMREGKYPDFDIVSAAEHPKYGTQFQRLLEAGIDVEAAYLASHHEQLIGKAQVETAKKAESATLEAIKAGSMRPSEIGAKAQQGIVHKSSVSQLTAEDRAEIRRRASRGEKIIF